MSIRNIVIIQPMLYLISFMSSPAYSDWAVAPDLESVVLWQMVAENRASVVSSVGRPGPENTQIKSTVFIIKKHIDSDDGIKWAIREKGYAPVMCEEMWLGYQYLGSSCNIPGILMNDITSGRKKWPTDNQDN